MRRQNGRQLARQSPAGDVRQAAYQPLLQRRAQQWIVAAVRRQQLVAQFLRQTGEAAGQRGRVGVGVEHPTRQREPVGVQAAGGQAQQTMALPDVGGLQQARAFHHPHHETGQIELPGGVHLRHLRRFAANQSAARRPAAVGNPLHQRFQIARRRLAERDVVQKEQRAGAPREDVVDIQGHQIAADRLKAAQLGGDFQLGADAVGAGYQHRLSHAAQLVQPGETAGGVHHFRAVRGGGDALDAVFQRLHPAQIDAGGAVGFAGRLSGQRWEPHELMWRIQISPPPGQ